MIRAVLDPNVLISAFISGDGPPARIVRAWAEGAFEIVASPLLISELTAVLARPKLQPQASEGRGEAYVASLVSGALLIEDPEDRQPLSSDPDDDYLIALALAVEADALVSGDRHLLEIEQPPVAIEAPRSFARRLDG